VHRFGKIGVQRLVARLLLERLLMTQAPHDRHNKIDNPARWPLSAERLESFSRERWYFPSCQDHDGALVIAPQHWTGSSGKHSLVNIQSFVARLGIKHLRVLYNARGQIGGLEFWRRALPHQ